MDFVYTLLKALYVGPREALFLYSLILFAFVFYLIWENEKRLPRPDGKAPHGFSKECRMGQGLGYALRGDSQQLP